MKHSFFVLLTCVLFISLVYGQIPKTISYQGLLTSPSGIPLEGAYDLKFTLYASPAGGSILWTEMHTGIAVSKGTFNVILGVDSPFTSVNFAQQLYIEVMEGTNTFSPRSPLTSAPTALVANAVSGDGNVSTTGVIDATGQHSKIRFFYDDTADFPSAATYHGMFAHAHNQGKAYVAHAGSWIPLAYEDHQHSKLAASDGSPSDAVSVDANGNVGIGTTSPGQKLDVSGGSVRIANVGDGVITNNLSAYDKGVRITVGSNDQVNHIVLNPGSANVGIGTTSPSEKLHVIGNRIRFENPSLTKYILMRTDGGELDLSATGARLFISAGLDLVLNGGGGDVGIQNTNPAYPLEVGTDATNGNGAHVTVGGVWTNGSDKNSKKDFQQIDKNKILEKVVELPITQWRYKSEPNSISHIGPMAQDFYEAFHLGENERFIGTVDADGVALAAIQQLYKENQELRSELEALKGIVKSLAGEKQQGKSLGEIK